MVAGLVGLPFLRGSRPDDRDRMRMSMFMVLLAQQAEGGGASEVFHLSANVSFWTVVIFLALLAVLARFAFPPILGYAAAREKRIQDAIDEAQRLRDEGEKLLQLQRQELGAAKEQAQQILLEARQAADRVREELLNQTRTEQQHLLERARQDIATDRERSLQELRRDAVDLAIAAAGKLIERRLGSDEDRRLVTEYLGRVSGGAN